jgi:hypothetical protein
MLQPSPPVPRVHVLVHVGVESLTRSTPVLPLPVVLALTRVHGLPNAVLLVVAELALVLVPIGLGVLALPAPLATDVLAFVVITIGVTS